MKYHMYVNTFLRLRSENVVLKLTGIFDSNVSYFILLEQPLFQRQISKPKTISHLLGKDNRVLLFFLFPPLFINLIYGIIIEKR